MAAFGRVPPLKHCPKEHRAATASPCQEGFGLHLLGRSRHKLVDWVEVSGLALAHASQGAS